MYRITKVEHTDKTRYYAQYRKWFWQKWKQLNAFSKDSKERCILDIEYHKESQKVKITYENI